MLLTHRACRASPPSPAPTPVDSLHHPSFQLLPSPHPIIIGPPNSGTALKGTFSSGEVMC